MKPRTHHGRRIALALVLAAWAATPAAAQVEGDGPQAGNRHAPPPPQGQPGPQGGQAQPRKHHHGSGLGAAIGAGVVGGLVGGALLNGQRQAPDYPPQPAYAPPPPPPPTYEVEDEPECRVVRKPVYDEDGEIVEYRTRRVCR